MEIIAEKLKKFFRERGLSQQQVADMLGVKQPYIYKVLNGHTPIGKKQAARISEIWGISPGWLLTGTGPMMLPGREGADGQPVNITQTFNEGPSYASASTLVVDTPNCEPCAPPTCYGTAACPLSALIAEKDRTIAVLEGTVADLRSAIDILKSMCINQPNQ